MVRVVSVMEPTALPLLPSPTGAAAPVVLEHDAAAYIEADRAAVVGRLSAPNRVVDEVLVRDRPASRLVDQAREFSADLVIVGSRGHGPIASLVLSVSAEVVDHAPCPVLVARRSTLERVVFATDGSDTAAEAEDILARWPIFAGVPIRVLSVADVVRPWTTGVAPTLYTQVLHVYAKDLAAAEADHLRIAREAANRLTDAARGPSPRCERGMRRLRSSLSHKSRGLTSSSSDPEDRPDSSASFWVVSRGTSSPPQALRSSSSIGPPKTESDRARALRPGAIQDLPHRHSIDSCRAVSENGPFGMSSPVTHRPRLAPL